MKKLFLIVTLISVGTTMKVSAVRFRNERTPEVKNDKTIGVEVQWVPNKSTRDLLEKLRREKKEVQELVDMYTYQTWEIWSPKHWTPEQGTEAKGRQYLEERKKILADMLAKATKDLQELEEQLKRISSASIKVNESVDIVPHEEIAKYFDENDYAGFIIYGDPKYDSRGKGILGKIDLFVFNRSYIDKLMAHAKDEGKPSHIFYLDRATKHKSYRVKGSSFHRSTDFDVIPMGEEKPII